MNELTLQLLFTRFAALVVLAAAAGFVMAAIARALGDRGPADDGRLTLNPVLHLDLMSIIVTMVFGLGWVKPLDVAPDRVRGGTWGIALMALGGLLAAILLALLAALLRPFAATMLGGTAAAVTVASIAIFIQTAAGFALVNLLPIAPFAAGHLLARWRPAAWALLRRNPPITGIVIIAVLSTGWVQLLLEPAVRVMAGWLGA
jgi:hypothetical protein